MNATTDKIWYVVVSDRRHRVHYWPEGRMVKLSGVDWQSVPSAFTGIRTRDYRYTHGGAVYRAACERIWRHCDEERGHDQDH